MACKNKQELFKSRVHKWVFYYYIFLIKLTNIIYIDIYISKYNIFLNFQKVLFLICDYLKDIFFFFQELVFFGVQLSTKRN